MPHFNIILKIAFYRESSGKEPVKEWMSDLTEQERKIIGEDIKRVQYGWPLGMPLVKPLGEGLWEIRSKFRTRIARIIFTLYAGHLILLHGFIKKTQKITDTDLQLAKKRLKTLK